MAAFAVFFYAPVHAQSVCDRRDDIVAQLFDKHDEVKNVQGLLASGTEIVEIFSGQSPGERGRTFTIIVTYPNGTSCVVMVGHYWRYVTSRGI